MAGGEEFVPGGERGDDQQEVDGAVARKAAAQAAGLVQAAGQVFHGAQASGFELGDDWQHLGLGAR